MAGHSKWSNIKHKKAREDRRKGKIFGKFSRKIISAARRGGGDPDKNIELNNIIERARDQDMPKDSIERAIKRGTGDLPGVEYEDAVYEGYGPGGIAIIVDVTTDNKNRSIAQIRKIFDEHNGNVGARGCVSYLFERKGYLTLPLESCDELQLFELVVEAGADDLKKVDEDDQFEIYTSVENFSAVKQTLLDNDLQPQMATIARLPKTTVQVDERTTRQVLRLLEELDDHQDVQEVDSNLEIVEQPAAVD